MTTWTLSQIDQASGIRGAARIDRESLDRARLDVLQHARRRLVRTVQHVGHSLAIEIHEADVRFREIDVDENLIEVRAWWEPQVREVEFRGGPRDGQRLEVQRPGDPIRTIEDRGMMTAGEYVTSPEAVSTQTRIYSLAGWREQDRVWVYDAT